MMVKNSEGRREGFFGFSGHYSRTISFHNVAKQSSELREENVEEKLTKTGQKSSVSAAIFYQVISHIEERLTFNVKSLITA